MQELFYALFSAAVVLLSVWLGAKIARPKEKHAPAFSEVPDPIREQWGNLFAYDGTPQAKPEEREE